MRCCRPESREHRFPFPPGRVAHAFTLASPRAEARYAPTVSLPATDAAYVSAVDALYRTFSRPRPHTMDVCPCCAPAGTPILLARPLRALTAEVLSHYVFKAMTTMGTVGDFKYFLPRILELIAAGLPVDLPIVLGKLPYAKWETWPAVEIEACVRFFHELWASALRDGWCGDTSELLQAYTGLFDDLGPFLQRWDETDTPHASVLLARLLREYLYVLTAPRATRGDWWRDPGRAQIGRWLVRPANLSRLEALVASGEAPDDDAETLSYLLEGLRAQVEGEG
jgi:hypothetical protein